MQGKRDEELEKEIGQWIEAMINEPLEFPTDLISSLTSGIVLCK